MFWEGNDILSRIQILPSSILFSSILIDSPYGAYNACCHYKCKALLKHLAIVSIFYGWMNQFPYDSIAPHGASNQQLFSHESYTLTNCAIKAWHILVLLLHSSICLTNDCTSKTISSQAQQVLDQGDIVIFIKSLHLLRQLPIKLCLGILCLQVLLVIIILLTIYPCKD